MFGRQVQLSPVGLQVVEEARERPDEPTGPLAPYAVLFAECAELSWATFIVNFDQWDGGQALQLFSRVSII